MFRSLYSGVSGMSAQITNLDVIGNNIANSSTVGFKAGRVTFSEMLTQTIRGATRPVSGGMGGTNPQQIGLGTRVGSIDTIFNQGNFQTTGMKTDLAIQGNGFFILNDGTSSLYSRAGVFGLDSQSILVNPATGWRVQGVMADSMGNIGTGPLTDIFIDPGLVMPASASTDVQLMGNLDSSSDSTGSITESRIFMASADGTDRLTAMSGMGNGPLGLSAGDVIQLNGTGGGLPLGVSTFTVADDSTLQDLVSWLNRSMTTARQNVAFAIDSDGAVQITNNTGQDLIGVSLSSGGLAAFNSNFLFEPTITAGQTARTNELRSYAAESDLLSNLYDSNGRPLDIDTSNPAASLTLGGAVGGTPVTDHTMAINAASTLGDVMRDLQFTLGINSNPVVLNDTGQIIVTGEVGGDFALSGLSVRETGVSNPVLEGAFSFTQTQAATDAQVFSLATTVYDSLGAEHTVAFSFEKIPDQNEWTWTATMEGGETILSGGSGRVAFADNGALTSYTFDDGSGALTFQPQANGTEGAANVVLNLDFGEAGTLTGLTQFEGTGAMQSIADGYGAGNLLDFSIDRNGVIIGIFSNDTTQDLARIGLAQFTNQEGLSRVANNTYRISGNSGLPLETFAGEGNAVAFLSGALENSNVDLAKEFTDLIVAQRAFQANSRVISTADQMMQELVNMVG
ncbi:MAG: flagellar hook-basal body complex protein [Candidatus Krumholzibacteria bacterium]|nr:flagellar hook-basal body complex protein [Candidatus Krumholzibacteria bacterium]